MKINLRIQAKYSETYLFHEPDVYHIDSIVASIIRHGTHIPFEWMTFNDNNIFIHKHKTFDYILAFERPYNRERFL
jgi:hypothetical protein